MNDVEAKKHIYDAAVALERESQKKISDIGMGIENAIKMYEKKGFAEVIVACENLCKARETQVKKKQCAMRLFCSVFVAVIVLGVIGGFAGVPIGVCLVGGFAVGGLAGLFSRKTISNNVEELSHRNDRIVFLDDFKAITGFQPYSDGEVRTARRKAGRYVPMVESWACSSCGSINTSGDTCPKCGAKRT